MIPRSCLLLLVLVACLGPTAPEDVRYHHPVTSASEVVHSGPVSGMALRLRRVAAASSIVERILWRDPSGRVGYFELDRWAERPLDVLERVLARQLFEVGGFRRSESASASALDVQLTAFELVRGPDGPTAHVRVVAQLFERSGGDALLERTFEQNVPLEEPVPGPELSQALGRALRAVSHDLAEAAGEAAGARASAP